MNNQWTDDECLNKSLSKPAAVSDNGFVESVQARLLYREQLRDAGGFRRKVFTAVAIISACLLLIAVPPAIYY